MSTLYDQYTDIYTKLASFKVEFDSVKRDLQNLQSMETSDNQYAHSHISSLSSKYTSLSSLVREFERRVSTLEHNLDKGRRCYQVNYVNCCCCCCCCYCCCCRCCCCCCSCCCCYCCCCRCCCWCCCCCCCYCCCCCCFYVVFVVESVIFFSKMFFCRVHIGEIFLSRM